MTRFLCPAYITEMIFIEGVDALENDRLEILMYYLSDFCVDKSGNIRINRGLVSPGPTHDDDPTYVPSVSYGSVLSPWNSHSVYITIELPNPAIEFDHYELIRDAWIDELTTRLNTDLRRVGRLKAACNL